jgi:hypothetical protein
MHMQVTEYLQAEGMDASDTALDQLFECYDADGTHEYISAYHWLH